MTMTWSDRAIVVQIPDLPPGEHMIRVVTPSGRSAVLPFTLTKETSMSALDDAIAEVVAEANATKSEEDSAILVLNDYGRRYQAAYDAGIAAGATPAQLQLLRDTNTALAAKRGETAAAIANVPAQP